MKKIYIISFISLLFIASCDFVETKVLDLKAIINFSPDVPYSGDDDDGAFFESETIDPDVILDEIEDLDTETLSEVNISSLNLRLVERNGNQANTLRLSGYYQDNNTPQTALFQDYILDIADFTGSELKPISGYQATGINILTDKVFQIIKRNDFESFVISMEGVAIDAGGNESGDHIRLDIYVELETEAIFSEEVDLPDIP